MNINKEINELSARILDDYGQGRTIDQMDPFTCPDKAVVEDIIEKLQKVIFPGYFRTKAFFSYTVENSLRTLVEDILHDLTKQISRFLRYLPEYENADFTTSTEAAQKVTFEFLHKLPEIRKYMETIVEAEFDGDPAAFNKDEIIFSYPGLYAIMVYRLAHEFYMMNVPVLPRIMSEYAHSKTGIDIHPGATIDEYFFIDHGTGIVIGETTVIGKNVKVYQGVTIGALSTRGGQKLRSKKRHPTIEDNVTIYSGASILGGDTVIGKGAVIGGNTFITESIPAGAVVSIKEQELKIKESRIRLQCSASEN